MTGFGVLDYTLFAIYLIASVAVGALFVKEQHTMKDFFLAGRSMGSLIVAISVLAALFSGITYLAAPSEIYENGTAIFVMVAAFFIATPFTTVFLMPFFYRARFISVYQYLGERFSQPVRLLASGLFIFRVVLWLALATYAPAIALQAATGMPIATSILLTGILTTMYTMMGGMKAVIVTDVMQFFVLFGGQLAIVIVALNHVPGGLGEAMNVAATHGQPLPSASLDPTVRITWLGALVGAAVLHLVQMATDQVSVQRYMTAKSMQEARKGLWIKLAFTLPVLGLFYMSGVVLRAFYNHAGDPVASGAIAKADYILPYFVVNELPDGMPGILVAAIYAASMSTISAGLNSLASATMVDFQYRKPGSAPTDRLQIRQARIWTGVYGMIVLGFAFVVPLLGNLMEATNTIMGMIGGPLLGLFIIGVFIARIGAKAALFGCLAGSMVAIAVMKWESPRDLASYQVRTVQVASVAGVPAEGRRQIVIAEVGPEKALHLRLFDDNGNLISERAGERIPGRVQKAIAPLLAGSAPDQAKLAAAAKPLLIKKVSFFWYTFVGMGTTIFAALLLSFLFPGRPKSELRGLVWDNSMFSNEEVKDQG